ncbi:S1C family serine protease [Nocardioides aurantiacus]|uniref:S1-C subfamily serine protease n=1 Tax=Nocardioides aurantiacus TaxID=86796 RepID=A0A3N2CVA5_9ACTN|nr:trypsin-like peptidase domain-containing protein [Nocardioides aurantiacus]ROR91164.1 S1-C subfamily serine protease [Nocardioides aurantiacus]
MDDRTPSPSYDAPPAYPLDPAAVTTEPRPSGRERRRRVLRRAGVPAMALTLLVGAGGVGYALGRPGTPPGVGGTSTAPSLTRGPQDGSGATQGTQPPGWSLPSAPSPQTGDGAGVDTSGDTSGTASGDQLTGLVRIATTQSYAGAEAAGTGMVLTADGEVVTNHHVVEGATDIEVTVMATGTTYAADVVGSDAAADVALLRLDDASGLATVTTDSDGVAVGDAVTAVGDGEGAEDHLSAATGSVLATDQQITTRSGAGASVERLSDLVQISSDVVSGYSGGATYDEDGEVVGMTTAASSGTTDVVGYAVPVATVLRIAGDLEQGVQDAAYAYGRPAFLGVALDGTGTTLAGVYDATPAADAGLAEGDTITAVDGEAVGTAERLRAAVSAHEPGDSVEISWTDASGTTRSATVELTEGPVA